MPMNMSKSDVVRIQSMVYNHEKLLRNLDWVDRHKVWSTMLRLRGFRKLLIKLEMRFSPDELLLGKKTGRRAKGPITLKDKCRDPPVARKIPKLIWSSAELPGVECEILSPESWCVPTDAAAAQPTLMLFGFKKFIYNVFPEPAAHRSPTRSSRD